MWTSNGVNTSATLVSTIERFTFNNDTGTALPRSPTTFSVGLTAASENSTDAWIAGGSIISDFLSTVNRVTFANDTTLAAIRGSLSIAR